MLVCCNIQFSWFEENETTHRGTSRLNAALTRRRTDAHRKLEALFILVTVSLIFSFTSSRGPLVLPPAAAGGPGRTGALLPLNGGGARPQKTKKLVVFLNC